MRRKPHRMYPEWKEYLVTKMEEWPRTTQELGDMCKEHGFPRPTLPQCQRIVRELWRAHDATRLDVQENTELSRVRKELEDLRKQLAARKAV